MLLFSSCPSARLFFSDSTSHLLVLIYKLAVEHKCLSSPSSSTTPLPVTLRGLHSDDGLAGLVDDAGG